MKATTEKRSESETTQHPIIVAVAGLPKSGVTTITETINDLGYPSYSMVEATGIDRDLFRESNVVVVDGLTSWEEASWLKDKYNAHVPIICVDAEFNARLQRYDGSVRELESRDERLLTCGLDTLLDHGHLVVYNGIDMDEDDLEERVCEVMEVITHG